MPEDEDVLNKLAKKLYGELNSKGTVDVEEFSEETGVSQENVWEVAKKLNKKRNDVKIVGNKKDGKIYMNIAGLETPDYTPIDKIVGKIRIGVISDTRLGSKYQSLTPLYAAYSVFDHFGVDFVIHAGNVFAGHEDKSRFGEMFIKDPGEQVDYVEAIYPQIKGVKTYMLSSYRDKSFSFKGKSKSSYTSNVYRDLVRELTERREDLVYVGDDWKFPLAGSDTVIRVMHPVDEAAPRGKSYGLQTIMEEIGNFMKTVDYESIMKTEKVKNTIIVIGGYHTPIHIPDHGGLTAGFSLPSLYAQSPFLRRRKISPTIGAYMLELDFNSEMELERGGISATFIPLNKFIEKYDYFEKPRKKVGLDDIDTKVLESLRMELSLSYGELSRRLGASKDVIRRSVEKLKQAYNSNEKTVIVSPEDNVNDSLSGKRVVYYPDYVKKFTPTEIDFNDMFNKKFKMASVSDTHLGSKDDESSVHRLQDAYSIAEQEKCDFVTHAGDVSDGTAAVGYRAHKNDAKFSTVDELVDYLVQVYPKSKIKTKMISGNHDGWIWDEVGHDLVKAFAKDPGRGDIEYLGRLYQVFDYDGVEILQVHGGGGTGYTLSQKPQNLLRYISKYNPDVKVVNIGNYHKAIAMYLNGTLIYLDSSTVSPTDYAKTQGFPEFIGFWVKEITRDKSGNITSATNRYFDQRKIV